jgi:hypothetical protein
VRVPADSATIVAAVAAAIDRLNARSRRSSAVMKGSRPCRVTGARDQPSHFHRIRIDLVRL